MLSLADYAGRNVLKTDGPDVLSAPSIASFLQVREAIPFMCRDSRARTVPAICNYLKLASDGGNEDIVDRFFFAEARCSLHLDDLTNDSRLKDWMNVLGIEKQVSFSLLKSHYRKAAFRFHPDRDGGDLEMMKKANKAFASLHDFLCNRLRDEDEVIELREAMSSETVRRHEGAIPWRECIRTAKDFRLYLMTLLLCEYVDDYDLPAALSHHVYMHALLAPLQKEQHEWRKYYNGSFAQQSFFLAKFLALAGSTDEAWKVFLRAKEAEELNALNFRSSVCYGNVPREEALARGTEDSERRILIFDGNHRPRVVPSHLRQINNAYKYGVLTSSQYKKRLHSAQSVIDEDLRFSEMLADYGRSSGFLDELPPALRAEERPFEAETSDEFVEPYGLVEAEHWAIGQQKEYLAAFYGGGDLGLVRKYSLARSVHFLRSAIEFQHYEILSTIAEEAKLLARVQARRKRLAPWFLNKVAEFCSRLLSQTSCELEQRCEMLRLYGSECRSRFAERCERGTLDSFSAEADLAKDVGVSPDKLTILAFVPESYGNCLSESGTFFNLALLPLSELSATVECAKHSEARISSIYWDFGKIRPSTKHA